MTIRRFATPILALAVLSPHPPGRLVAQDAYRTPPAEVIDILDAAPFPQAVLSPSGGSAEVRITAGNRLTTYRAARSAFSAVGPDTTGPCRESGKTGTVWRDFRARALPSREAPGKPPDLLPRKPCCQGASAIRPAGNAPEIRRVSMFGQ